ncbi:FxsB family cyclophane-forming radical SAM/SPASM peptide maturase [Actinoplanes sp. CA-030573]|uniref:FxsB family cyclophane-forming radical SAM/SPASM peptide maturase n=1 Tax=Actinoplanes sp. CA-030573 TaxID=3239898 RepID=UPI003D8E4EFD
MRFTASPATRPGHPDWPHRRLDLDELRRSGWRSTPFHDFVLKVHQRCNLACDYCYVYESADQSWRGRPKLMPAEIREAAVRAIARHVRDHGLTRVSVVLHGGEPLLAGPDILVGLASDLRNALPGSCRLSVGMQTNGVALTPPVLERLAAARIRIGVSVDGAAESHDRHRRFRSGAGSHAAVARALRALAEPRFRHAYAGLLCTVDVAADPIEAFEFLLSYHPPAIDFLLPHANWENPPTVRYADWLTAVFDRWYGAPRRETGIRLFDDIISLLLGGSSRSEQVGLSPVAVAVVESDGDIELVDSLKTAYPGACGTGLTVLSDPFDAALDHPGVAARQIGEDALGDECRGCSIRRVCGGGHFAHRYRAVSGFQNPSVYCADMQILIHHIGRRVAADLGRLRPGDPR